MNNPLTERQRAILELIQDYIDAYGFAPSIRDIMDHSGIGSPNGVMCHINALTRKGYLRRGENVARSLQPLCHSVSATRTGDRIRVQVPRDGLSDEQARRLAEELLELAGEEEQ